MRAHMRGAPPTRVAGVLITLEGSSSGVLHAGLMDGVKHHVQAHPKAECGYRPRATAQAKYGEHREGRVEGSGRAGLSSGRSVVEAHRRRRTHPTLLKAEREVVIGVDQHRSGPKQDCVPAKPAA